MSKKEHFRSEQGEHLGMKLRADSRREGENGVRTLSSRNTKVPIIGKCGW